MSASANTNMHAGRSLALCLLAGAALAGCAHMGRLDAVPQTVATLRLRSTDHESEKHRAHTPAADPATRDTLIGFVPGTADSTLRYLGRLRNGYTADTLNVFLLGDNRPGWRSTRLAPEYRKIQQMISPNPVRILRGLVTIPVLLAKGLYPDLALLRDIPGRIRHLPVWGPERTVVAAMLAKIDSMQTRKQAVSAIINTGDLVNDGRYPAHWQRFLGITQPLTSRVPYFAVAGNHDRTDAVDGMANWHTATGLPVGGDRMYYCFDSADGWVRFIALDSNPMVDPAHLWTQEVRTKYSEEEISWMVARLREHRGPAFVFMHHPPFSVGCHRNEWQADSILNKRRVQMMQAFHDAGLGVMANGHEHAYERALFQWPDAILIDIVTGGGGAPLYVIPPPAQSAALMASYQVAGSTVEAKNVVTGSFNHFIQVRLWFGGGELETYAVNSNGKTSLADKVRIDLARYGVPKIDEHKMPIPPKVPAASGPHEENLKKPNPAASDSTANSKRLLDARTPKQSAKPAVSRAITVRDSLAATKRDSVTARRRR
jgi:hypothetical protein